MIANLVYEKLNDLYKNHMQMTKFRFLNGEFDNLMDEGGFGAFLFPKILGRVWLNTNNQRDLTINNSSDHIYFKSIFLPIENRFAKISKSDLNWSKLNDEGKKLILDTYIVIEEEDWLKVLPNTFNSNILIFIMEKN